MMKKVKTDKNVKNMLKGINPEDLKNFKIWG
jgi:hypothetical protein